MKKNVSIGYAPSKLCNHCREIQEVVGVVEISSEKGARVEYAYICIKCLSKMQLWIIEQMSNILRKMQK